MTSSPIVYGDRVYVGVSAGENILGKDHDCCTFRGHLDAMDAETGSQVWRFYTTPEPREDGTWPNGRKRYAPSGAGVWSSPSIDPYTRTLFVGTGQNYTGSAGHYDPDGMALDIDLGASPNLFRAGGRSMVGIGQKSGVFHVLDARTGKIVWQRQLSTPMPGGGLSGIQWGTSYDGERLYVATYMARPTAAPRVVRPSIRTSASSVTLRLSPARLVWCGRAAWTEDACVLRRRRHCFVGV